MLKRGGIHDWGREHSNRIYRIGTFRSGPSTIPRCLANCRTQPAQDVYQEKSYEKNTLTCGNGARKQLIWIPWTWAGAEKNGCQPWMGRGSEN